MIKTERKYRIFVDPLPRLLGWKIRLDFFGDTVPLGDGTSITVLPHSFEWEVINIDGGTVLMWHDVGTGETHAKLAFGAAEEIEAHYDGHVLLVRDSSSLRVA